MNIEKLKQKWQRKIEKNAFKSTLSWTDDKGVVHSETVYFKRSGLPLIGDWARIYPPLTEDGKTDWFNLVFGGKKNFIKLLLIMGLVGLVFLGYKDMLFQLKTLLDNPCVQTCFNPFA